MSEIKVCRRCGSQIAAADRFCGECGFDTLAALGKSSAEAQPPAAPVAPSPAGRKNPTVPPAASYDPPLGRSTGNKKALFMLIAILTLAFLGGGGYCWWLTRGGEGPAAVTSLSPAEEKGGQAAVSASPAAKTPDLTRAETYLPEPGLKCTFFVNYPDGTAGIVERVSARVVPARTVRVSEVETRVERGETIGYGFHYAQWADGTYYILDQNPEEIVPVLKNDLTVGKTWSYRNEFGQITWTVQDMGVNLDLGFATFDNCLVVREDNQPAEFQSITYYAPGRGIVLVRDPAGSVDYYKLTALTLIGEAQTRETVIRWAPNSQQIVGDRPRM